MCPAIHIHRLMVGPGRGRITPTLQMPTLRLHEVRAFPGRHTSRWQDERVKAGPPGPPGGKGRTGVARHAPQSAGHSPWFPTGAHTLLLSDPDPTLAARPQTHPGRATAPVATCSTRRPALSPPPTSTAPTLGRTCWWLPASYQTLQTFLLLS